MTIQAIKIAVPVREPAAADDQRVHPGEVRQRLVTDGSIRLLNHVHLHQRNGAVKHRLQMRGHAVAIQREAPDDHIGAAIQVENRILVSLMAPDHSARGIPPCG